MSDYTYDAKVLDVIDGDTIVCLVDLGFDIHIRQHLRLYGINAREIHSKDAAEKAAGIEAKIALKGLLTDFPIIIETFKDATEKYGRLLAKVRVLRPGTPALLVNDEMIRLGHARAYFGGKR